MNLKTRIFFLFFLINISLLRGQDIDPYDIGSEPMAPSVKNGRIEPKWPFSLTVRGDSIGKSKFTHKKNPHSIGFSECDIELGFAFYYDREVIEGAIFNVGYVFANIDWHDNPVFNQHHFNVVTFSVNGFTKRMCKWLWIGQVGLNINADHFSVSEYSNEDFILWGKYDYMDNIHLHVGFVGMTGMKIDRFYPILGFDWRFCEDWMLNLVFPVNISLVYTLNDNWSFSTAFRAFDFRQRVGKRGEIHPRSLVEYRNYGGELAVNYELEPWITMNVHGGITGGGTLRTATRHYKHIHRREFNSAGYVGGELSLRY